MKHKKKIKIQADNGKLLPTVSDLLIFNFTCQIKSEKTTIKCRAGFIEFNRLYLDMHIKVSFYLQNKRLFYIYNKELYSKSCSRDLILQWDLKTYWELNDLCVILFSWYHKLTFYIRSVFVPYESCAKTSYIRGHRTFCYLKETITDTKEIILFS